MKWILVLAAIVATASQAQELEIKGIKPGQTYSEINDIHAGLFCQPYGCVYEPGVTVNYSPPPTLETFAGASVRKWGFILGSDERLAVLNVSLPVTEGQNVIRALTDKYGKPTQLKQSSYETVGGVKTTRTSASWERGDVALSIQTPGDRLTETSIQLFSKIAAARINLKQRAGAAKDL